MLSFCDVIIWCYHLVLSFGVIIFYVIIWCYHFSQFANVIFFVLSFFLIQDGCYHLSYHLMLSFFVIISPLFSFSWKRDTLIMGMNYYTVGLPQAKVRLPGKYNLQCCQVPSWLSGYGPAVENLNFKHKLNNKLQDNFYLFYAWKMSVS